MISRRSARAIADAYQKHFTSRGYHGSQRSPSIRATPKEFYDFLYEREYEAWFCNLAGKLYGERAVLEFVMKLHTGETIVSATEKWSWEQRTKHGQRLLVRLAEDMLNKLSQEPSTTLAKPAIQTLSRPLELDGYVFKDGELRREEQDHVDVREAHGVIGDLYHELVLPNDDVALHHLKLSEDHYIAGKWDDSIGNSRKFLEQVLREVASAHCTKTTGSPLTDKKYEKPVEVRQYLEGAGLLDKPETEATAKVYGLLSHTGSHPYIAAGDQARLLRHLALTFAQFVMLRWQGMKAKLP